MIKPYYFVIERLKLTLNNNGDDNNNNKKKKEERTKKLERGHLLGSSPKEKVNRQSIVDLHFYESINVALAQKLLNL